MWRVPLEYSKRVFSVCSVVLCSAISTACASWPDCHLVRLDASTNESGSKIPWATKFDKHRRKKRPVLLQGLAKDWPARKLWNPPEKFAQRFKSVRFPLKPSLVTPSSDTKEATRTSLATYLGLQQDSSNGSSQPDLDDQLLFDFGDSSVHQTLIKDVSTMHPSLLKVREETSFSIGRPGVGSGFHVHSEAWQAQVVGRKYWLLAARPPDQDSLLRYAKLNPCKLLKGELSLQGDQVPDDLCAIEVQEGDALYFPDKWLHATCNSHDTTATIAIGGRGDSSAWPWFFHSIVDGKTDKLATIETAELSKIYGSRTALITAASGPARIVEELLELRADPMVASTKGSYPLEEALGVGHLPCAKLLMKAALRQGLDIERNAELLWNPVATQGHLPLSKYLYNMNLKLNDKSMPTQPLHMAAVSGNFELVKWMLKQRAAPNAKRDDDAESPLSVAAHAGAAGVAQALILGRAKVNSKNKNDFTALHHAAKQGYIAIVESLVQARAMVDARDRNDKTPADIAREKGYSDVVQYLHGSIHGSKRESAMDRNRENLLGSKPITWRRRKSRSEL